MACEGDGLKTILPVEEEKGDVCRELRKLQILVGLATTTSSLTATIYLPLLPLLRTHFSTSAQAVNLTLTIYIVFQAISPVIFGPLSDIYGRRPIFLLVLGIYAVSNIGLAVNERSFVALATLRALQSLGASATYSIAFGVVADVCLPRDRGRMLGPIGMALNLGTCVGPIIGGCVAYFSGSYNWAFWALVIAGLILFLAVGLLLSETARSLVGNGSDRSRFDWWQISWLSLVQESLATGSVAVRNKHPVDDTDQAKPLSQTTSVKRFLQKYGLINFYNCFRIIFHKDTFLILWVHGSFYTVDYSFVAAVPDIFKSIYGWNEWQTGLAYLPRGTGIILGSYFTGRFLDHNYKTVARKIGKTESKASGGDLVDFPIEISRTRGSFIGLAISTVTMAGYGWALHQRSHPAVVLALQFLQGFWGTFFYTTYSALLVDSFPQSPSTAAATTSVTRCAMAATGVAILQPLMDAAGRGWYFTALGLWSGIFSAAAIFLLRWRGMRWRRERIGIVCS
ncbi:major facilitator superfamily domain-containing protein [Diaporthe sp. PMI_573]|nr:major facilitator superfamily domain-containing protein [Diaporthaceae sp. PMI_573]